MIDHAARIGDPPMPRLQLDRIIRIILYPDVIDPEPFAGFRLGLLRQEIHRHANGDVMGNGGVLKKLFHITQQNSALGQSRQIPCAIYSAARLLMRRKPRFQTGPVLQRVFVEQVGTGFIQADNPCVAAVAAHAVNDFIESLNRGNIPEMRA